MGATVGNQPATVLAIDDSAAARMFVRLTLELEGFRVLEAAAGSEGLDMLSAHPEVSVVVLDLVLPGRGGLQIAEAIRSMVGRSVGVVAFTGTIPSASGGLHPALDAMVLKPARPEVLVGAVLAHMPDAERESRGVVEVHAPPPKIEADVDHPRWIHTVRRVGYRFEPDSSTKDPDGAS